MKPRSRLASFRTRLRWLRPGLGIKRWAGLLVIGAMFVVLGLSNLLEWADTAFLGLLPDVSNRALQLIPRPGWAVLFGLLGAALILWAFRQMKRVLLAPFVRPGQSVAKVMSEHRQRGRGPKIVAMGGGTGLSTLLRGLKQHTSNLTAIVTVADDGGSSGRLRRSLGVLPPGDFRNCIAALADDESLTTQLFQYRFGTTDSDLGGHSFGNLFITAMVEVTGSFEQALLESSNVLAIRGRVLPSTLRDVTLVGELVDEEAHVNRVEGESRITLTAGAIRRVYLQPDDAPAYPDAIRAILDADLIVLGPGSLYTSLMPNLLVRDLAEAVRASRALKAYVCNTATQPGETDGYTVLDHLHAIERHTWPGLFPIVFANSNQKGRLLPHLDWVRFDSAPVGANSNGAHRLILADLAEMAHPWRHDSAKLAGALMTLLANTQGTAPVTENLIVHDLLKETLQ